MRRAVLSSAVVLALVLPARMSAAGPLFDRVQQLLGWSSNDSSSTFAEQSQGSDDVEYEGNKAKPLWQERLEARQAMHATELPGGNFPLPFNRKFDPIENKPLGERTLVAAAEEPRNGFVNRIQERLRNALMNARPAMGASAGRVSVLTYLRSTIGGFASRLGQSSVFQALRQWRNSAFGETNRFGESVQRAYAWGGQATDVGTANLGYAGWRMRGELTRRPLVVAAARPALKSKADEDSRKMIFKARDARERLHRERRLRTTRPFTVE